MYVNHPQNCRFSLLRKGQNNLMGFSKSGGGPWNCHCNKMFSLLLSNALSILPHKHFYIFRHFQKMVKKRTIFAFGNHPLPPLNGSKADVCCLNTEKMRKCDIFGSDLFLVMKMFIVYLLKFAF